VSHSVQLKPRPFRKLGLFFESRPRRRRVGERRNGGRALYSLRYPPNPRAAQFAEAGVSGFGQASSVSNRARRSSNFMFGPRRSSDHAVRAAEPEWAATPSFLLLPRSHRRRNSIPTDPPRATLQRSIGLLDRGDRRMCNGAVSCFRRC
jgi:hypothetical protein